MLIQTVEGKNFRDLPDFSLNLHERLNVFTGNNGVGKTAILNFITLMISQCRSITSERLNAKNNDINNNKTELSGKIKCKHDESYILAEYLYSEKFLQSHSFENLSGNFNDINEENCPILKLYTELKNSIFPFEKNFPLVVSYPTNRTALEIPERLREFKPAVHPFDALENALESNLDFRSFIALFRMNEKAFEQDANNHDPYIKWQAKQVKAVNDAICSYSRI